MSETRANVVKVFDQGDREGQAELHVAQSNVGVCIEFRNHQGISLASVVVELYGGEIRVYAWDEDREGNDPSQVFAVVQNSQDAYRRTFDDEGNIVSNPSDLPQERGKN